MIPDLPLAEFSADAGGQDGKGLYRYTLWRRDLLAQGDLRDLWENPRSNITWRFCYVQFIGLNPSTADETKNDPTITRCINFAIKWGFGAMLMTNAFAWRDTHPEKMKKQKAAAAGDPRNLARIIELAADATMIVPAWGSHGKFLYRDRTLREALNPFQAKIRCFHISMQGQPDHPLMQPKDVELVEFPL